MGLRNAKYSAAPSKNVASRSVPLVPAGAESGSFDAAISSETRRVPVGPCVPPFVLVPVPELDAAGAPDPVVFASAPLECDVKVPPPDDSAAGVSVKGNVVGVVVGLEMGTQCSMSPIDFIAEADEGVSGQGSLLFTIVRSVPTQFEVTSWSAAASACFTNGGDKRPSPTAVDFACADVAR